MDLKTPVRNIPNIGASFAEKLKKLNITTLEDLLYHFPTRHEIFQYKKISSVVDPQEGISIEGTVLQIANLRTKYGKRLIIATIADSTGSIGCVWFNQYYLTRVIKIGQKISVAGKVDFFNGKLTFINPEYELVINNNRPTHTRGLVPIYPETAGLSSKWLRSKIKFLLENVNLSIYEVIPKNILEKYALLGWFKALKDIHFPENEIKAGRARKRFTFEELFLLQTSALIRRQKWQKNRKAKALHIDQEKLLYFVGNLPFSLTSSQKKALRDILKDISQKTPMNRLLQGDVGSGKTVVAAAAAYITTLNGSGVLLMAPTEILATQHFQTLRTLLNPQEIEVSLVTATKKGKLNSPVIVGTHALIFNKDLPKNLGLVIIDEQHRFGVEQRVKLRNKGATSHFLTMSATPIPRTMALTLYGDLDLSIIDELPLGRKKIKTFVVPISKRDGAYNFIGKSINSGGQIFIICPLIEPSETLSTVKSAKAEWERLQREVFPQFRLGLLHGKLKPSEKDKVLGKFKEGELDILVATPVVEVGIDVPKASIILIEGAERFGLAQLHQLRGRVGRGSTQSYCLLFTESQNRQVLERLKFLEKNYIGLELAEVDLKLRGPGELFGTAQHGVPILKLASLTDTKLIEATRTEAERLLEKDPNLSSNTNLRNRIEGSNTAPD